MGKFDIPYLVERKNGFYWQPTKAFKEKAVEVLGFGFRALGKDQDEAIDTARSYNKAVKEALTSDQPKGFTVGTFGHLAAIYRGDEANEIEPTQEWIDLSDKSKSDYGDYVDLILAKWKHNRVEAVDIEVVEAFRDSMRKTPYKANNCLSVLSVMFSVALRKKSIFNITENPCKHVRKFGKKAGVRARRQYWTLDHEKKFMEAAKEHNTEMVLGYALLVYTGQRVGDVRGMTVADYDGEKIKVTQDKTEARVWIPVHRDLKVILDEHLAERKRSGRIGGTLLQTKTGLAFQKRYFARRWSEVMDKTGITENLQRRDLRRTAVTRLYEAGCTMRQVAAITGHTEKSVATIIETYTVTTYPMAQEAIRKLEEYRSGEDQK